MKKVIIGILLVGTIMGGCALSIHKPSVPCGCDCKIHFDCDNNSTKKGK